MAGHSSRSCLSSCTACRGAVLAQAESTGSSLQCRIHARPAGGNETSRKFPGAKPAHTLHILHGFSGAEKTCLKASVQWCHRWRHGQAAQQFCRLHLLRERQQVPKCGHMDEPATEHLPATQHSDAGGSARKEQQGQGSCLATAGFAGTAGAEPPGQPHFVWRAQMACPATGLPPCAPAQRQCDPGIRWPERSL